MNDDDQPARGRGNAQRERRRDRETNDPRIGQVFGDRYRVTERIGMGGMGVVYRARHLRLERPVVVKVLTDERLDDETSLARFEREAKTLSKLDHNNVVTVYDFGREGDLTYLVMEYVDGIELDDLVRDRGRLGMDLFAPIAAQILDGVGHAHKKGLVHRDLKPNNVMLTEREDNPYFVKVLDFGLAKLVTGASDVTAKDSIVGSMPYLSPEQIKGDDIDQRVDVYSLGIVFYYVLTGDKPFTGSRASILYDQVHAEPPPLHLQLPHDHEIPAGVIDLVHDCLAKDPNERPHDAKRMLQQLNVALEDVEGYEPVAQSGSSISAELVGAPSTRDHGEAAHQETPSQARRDSESPETARSAPRTTQGGTGGISWKTFAAAAVAGAFFAAGLVWYFTVASDEPTEATRATTEKTDTGVSQTDEAVAEIERLIDNDELDRADRKIASFADGKKAPTEVVDRLEQRLRAARSYNEARKHDEADELAAAIDDYEAAIDLVADFRDAESRLDDLDGVGLLEIDTDVPADVLLDGESVGKTPLAKRIEKGSHELLLEAEDGATHEETIEVEPGQTASVQPELAKVDEPDEPASDSPDDEPTSGTSAESGTSAAASGSSQQEELEGEPAADRQKPSKDDGDRGGEPSKGAESAEAQASSADSEASSESSGDETLIGSSDSESSSESSDDESTDESGSDSPLLDVP